MCAVTKQVLLKAKKDSWHKFCLNLNTSSSLTVFWNTAKCFKYCIQRSIPHHNEDWFAFFCDKITPPYVPSLTEINDLSLNSNSFTEGGNNFLLKPCLMYELKNAISSRTSPSSGLDGISPLILKHFLEIGSEILLKILYSNWDQGVIPYSWKQFRFISIPKHGIQSTAFRPISISLVFCKIVEHILKSRLVFVF